VSAEFAALVHRPLVSAGRFNLRGVAGEQELFGLAEG